MKKLILGLCMAALGVAIVLTADGATYTNQTVGGNTAFAARDAGKIYTVSKTLDFADLNMTTNDVVELVAFPADVRVIAVQAEVVSLSTTNTDTTQTLTIGDGSDTDGWVTSLSMLSAAKASSVPSVTTALTNNPHAYGISTAGAAYGLGKHYTSADTIDAKVAGDLVDGSFKVRVTFLDFNQ